VKRSGFALWIGLAGIIFVLAILAFARLRGVGPGAVHDLTSLPDRFTTCGRTWHGGQQLATRASIAARGIDLVLLDPAPLGDCPSNLHPTPIQTATVVFVRVGNDLYATYELVGGP
jgi:hypothetical protein